jgi:hypothetical protein
MASPKAYVWQDVDALWTAYLDYRDDSLFRTMDGPNGTSVESALAWARQHAAQVVVTVSDQRFSAGSEPVRDLPDWPNSGSAEEPERAAHPVTANVTARVEWLRRDRAEVADALTRQIEACADASDPRYSLSGSVFQVTFAVKAASVLRAREVAAYTLRQAWTKAQVGATAGSDYDLVSVTVSAHEHDC